MASFDCIIIGAGAAGLYCAMHAGRRGRRVLVLEHNEEAGAKILISGGGRCNFTNINASDHARYISANPHFARSALSRHTPSDFLALIDKHRIQFYEKTLGQLFCEGARSSRRIVDMLLKECTGADVVVRCGVHVSGVTHNGRFQVQTSAGAVSAETLVVASGGLSIPKLGASGIGYDIATQFGVNIIATRPGLVPLTFSNADLAWMQPLSGVSADISATASGTAFREAALFTHRGLSGPAILQASSHLQRGAPLAIDWLPNAKEDILIERKRARPKAQLKSMLAELLPDRLATALSGNLPAGALGDMKDATLTDAARALKRFMLTPVGDEGYAKAEVTVGGVDTNALSQQNMEARSVMGLFFVGEAVDVTGWLGGYNFQWAWSSGWAAGQSC
ncbi:MAG: NAD(P)/FAD-dependent oxidoreductase [Terricaulis sp.]